MNQNGSGNLYSNFVMLTIILILMLIIFIIGLILTIRMTTDKDRGGGRGRDRNRVKREGLNEVEETPSFQKDIKPLFTKKDRDSMLWKFDLHKYTDVKKNANDILRVVRSGYMPCYGPWNMEKVNLFESWMDSGYKR